MSNAAIGFEDEPLTSSPRVPDGFDLTPTPTVDTIAHDGVGVGVSVGVGVGAWKVRIRVRGWGWHEQTGKAKEELGAAREEAYTHA